MSSSVGRRLTNIPDVLQLLAGGPAHLRPVEELTTRLCFVCFDGSEALKVSRQLGSSSELPDDFVEKYCANVYHGIKVSHKLGF